MSRFNDELKHFIPEKDPVLPVTSHVPLSPLERVLEIGFHALRTEIDTDPTNEKE